MEADIRDSNDDVSGGASQIFKSLEFLTLIFYQSHR